MHWFDVQYLINSTGTLKDDATLRLTHATLAPLAEHSSNAFIAYEELDLKGRVESIVGKVDKPEAEKEWADSLRDLARGAAANKLLSCVKAYNENFQVAKNSVGNYAGGLELFLKTNDTYERIKVEINRCRETLQYCNLLQAMYKLEEPQAKKQKVAETLKGAPKKGHCAVHAKILEQANAMIA